MPKLGVNIDHVATVREARKASEPDPVYAARLCEDSGCDSIVCHLREDRRHIKDDDVKRLRASVATRFNLEMSIHKEIVAVAMKIKPDQATFVPERRQELTTEGGLDVVRHEKAVADAARRLLGKGIEVSLFINPDRKQIDAARRIGVGIIEIHTGEYANAPNEKGRSKALKDIRDAARYARSHGLVVNAGHGLTYDNVTAVAKIPGMNELNIGHSIIARAVFIGMERAVQEMITLIR